MMGAVQEVRNQSLYGKHCLRVPPLVSIPHCDCGLHLHVNVAEAFELRHWQLTNYAGCPRCLCFDEHWRALFRRGPVYHFLWRRMYANVSVILIDVYHRD